MDRDEVEVHKFAKKERGQYPAILTSHLVNKGFTLRLFGKFCLRDTAGSPERAISLHLALSGSESQRAISFILPARGASHIINPGYCGIISACKNISLGVWQQLHLQVFSEVLRGLAVSALNELVCMMLSQPL